MSIKSFAEKDLIFVCFGPPTEHNLTRGGVKIFKKDLTRLVIVIESPFFVRQ